MISLDTLRVCAGQLTEILANITNLLLVQTAVTMSFKTTSTMLVPKHSIAVSLNDFHPAVLILTTTKCPERLAYHPHWIYSKFTYHQNSGMD